MTETTRGKMKAIPTILMLLLFLGRGAIAASDQWTPLDNEDGIATFRKEAVGGVYPLKGITTFDIPIERILSVVLDTKNATDWVDLLESERVVRTYPRQSAVYLDHFRSPVPLISDREFLYQTKLIIDRKNHALVYRMWSINDPSVPQHPDRVRAWMYPSTWRFIPLQGGRTRIVVENSIDPKGSLPTWLVNLTQKTWPQETLIALRKQAQKPGLVVGPEVRKLFHRYNVQPRQHALTK